MKKNLTPHSINLNDGQRFPSSGQVARLRVHHSQPDAEGIMAVRFGEVVGLPDPAWVCGNCAAEVPDPQYCDRCGIRLGTGDGYESSPVYYIVSAQVAQTVPGRADVISPATGHPDTVRNEAGQIVSVPGFVRALPADVAQEMHHDDEVGVWRMPTYRHIEHVLCSVGLALEDVCPVDALSIRERHDRLEGIGPEDDPVYPALVPITWDEWRELYGGGNYSPPVSWPGDTYGFTYTTISGRRIWVYPTPSALENQGRGEWVLSCREWWQDSRIFREAIIQAVWDTYGLGCLVDLPFREVCNRREARG